MDIYTAAQYMRLGYRIRRTVAYWHHSHIQTASFPFVKLSLDDILSDDWEVITQGITSHFPITYQE